MDKPQEYLMECEKAREQEVKCQDLRKDVLTYLADDLKRFNELKEVIKDCDLIEKDWNSIEIENKNISDGLIMVFTDALNLTNDFNLISYERIKEDGNIQKRNIHLCKKGFYIKHDWAKNRSQLPVFNVIKDYLSNAEDLKNKIKQECKDEDIKVKLDAVFNFINEKEKQIDKDNPLFSYKFNTEEKRKVSFYTDEDFRDDKKELIILEINLNGKGIHIELDGENYHDKSYYFKFENAQDWNLGLYLSLRNEILKFINDAKIKIENDNREYVKSKKAFYEIIEPYLVTKRL